MHHPVEEYDGRTIPLPDESVDVVFSSHVLEHVSPLGPLLEESRRVMKSTGLAVHILPSSTWRVWTSIGHYPYVVKTLVFGPPADSLVDVGSGRDAIRRHGPFRAAYKTLIHPLVAHGSNRNALAEVAAFHERPWRAIFERNGFTVVTAPPTRIFYTGYGVLGRLSLEQRRRIAMVLGSSSRAFVLRRRSS
jgi:SAM-dependent methyltransferase